MRLLAAIAKLFATPADAKTRYPAWRAAMGCLLLAMVMFISSAHAAIRIDLNNPNAAPMPIAVQQFYGATPEAAQMAADITGVINNNFGHATPFKVLNPKAFLQTPEQLATGGPVFNDWKSIGADALLTGTVEISGGQIKVEYRLYDPNTEQQLIGRRYTVDSKFWRHVAHRISDDVYTNLTGEPGYFATRIVHIGETGSGRNIQKRLCVMDQDGANYQCLTDGSSLVLTPRFNPNLQKIIYMSYSSGKPRLYLLDMPTGQQTVIGDFEGLNSTPRFSPDGTKVAMTMTAGHEGNPEIYEMDLSSHTLKRLTYHRAIDTSPSYSPDGKQIVFNSDRGGQPALYIMDADGSNVRRLTYGDGRYYSPAWSPRGDLIAFVKDLHGTFHIGVIDPKGGEERLLTDSYMDDNPTWAPNGRIIVFSRQKPRSDETKIYTIDLTGYNLRELPTPTNASDPAWSPLIR
jgi:TolB protein